MQNKDTAGAARLAVYVDTRMLADAGAVEDLIGQAESRARACRWRVRCYGPPGLPGLDRQAWAGAGLPAPSETVHVGATLSADLAAEACDFGAVLVVSGDEGLARALELARTRGAMVLAAGAHGALGCCADQLLAPPARPRAAAAALEQAPVAPVPPPPEAFDPRPAPAPARDEDPERRYHGLCYSFARDGYYGFIRVVDLDHFARTGEPYAPEAEELFFHGTSLSTDGLEEEFDLKTLPDEHVLMSFRIEDNGRGHRKRAAVEVVIESLQWNLGGPAPDVPAPEAAPEDIRDDEEAEDWSESEAQDGARSDWGQALAFIGERDQVSLDELRQFIDEHGLEINGRYLSQRLQYQAKQGVVERAGRGAYTLTDKGREMVRR